MLASEPLFRRMGLTDNSLTSLQDREGRLEVVSELTLRVLGLRDSDLIGQKWQQFALEKERETEEAVIDRVWHTGNPVFFTSRHKYSNGLSVHTVQRVSVVTTRTTRLIMREAYRIDGLDPQLLEGLDPSQTTVRWIAGQLVNLREAAAQDDQELLTYLIDMAKLCADAK